MTFYKIVLTILLLSYYLLAAQTDFRAGYVIENTGDSIFGQIDYRGDLIMSHLCKFKSQNGAITEYYPGEISSYRFNDGKYYQSRKVNGKEVFLEFLIKGEVNIYYLRDELGDHYYIDKENERLSELPFEEGLTYEGNKQVEYETKDHVGILTYYMQDAFEFIPRIRSIRKPGHKNLIALAEDYHNLVCEDEQCIIYEKKPSWFKINIEVLAGALTAGNNNKNYFQGGVLAHLWVPRTNEKVYVKTGLLYSPREITVDQDQQLSAPLHIGYMAPKTYRLRPSISMGLISPSYSVGLSVRVGKHINLGLQGWADFHFDVVPWVPYKLKHYSILGSLYTEL